METMRGASVRGNSWLFFTKLVLSVLGVATLLLLVCGNYGCGSDETAPPIIVQAGADTTGGQPADDNNVGNCSGSERATLYVESLYGGQVVCAGNETSFEEAVEVSGICMANSGFSFVVYTEANSTFTAAYEDGRPAVLEFRIGTAPPELQSEFDLDWGAVVIVTVP